MGNKADAESAMEKKPRMISHKINGRKRRRESSRPNGPRGKKSQKDTYFDVEVFWVVKHGLEGLGLESHIDFDFLALIKFRGLNVREGRIQCCL